MYIIRQIMTHTQIPEILKTIMTEDEWLETNLNLSRKEISNQCLEALVRWEGLELLAYLL